MPPPGIWILKAGLSRSVNIHNRWVCVLLLPLSALIIREIFPSKGCPFWYYSCWKSCFSQTFLATYAAVYVVRSSTEIVAAWFLGSFGSVKRRELQPGQHTFAAFQMGSTWLRDLSSEVCDFLRYPWINLVWIPSLSARKKLKFGAERSGERMYQFRLSCVSLIPFRIPLYIIPSNSGHCLGLGESNALCTAIPSFTKRSFTKRFGGLRRSLPWLLAWTDSWQRSRAGTPRNDDDWSGCRLVLAYTSSLRKLRVDTCLILFLYFAHPLFTCHAAEERKPRNRVGLGLGVCQGSLPPNPQHDEVNKTWLLNC